MLVRTVSVQQRRALVVRRHHLDGDAPSAEAATRSVLAMHATDPASVYLSVLARSAGTTLGDVAEAMYERRALVRWMAMRRTLFLFPREDIPVVRAAVQHTAGGDPARQLVSRLNRRERSHPSDGDDERPSRGSR